MTRKTVRRDDKQKQTEIAHEKADTKNFRLNNKSSISTRPLLIIPSALGVASALGHVLIRLIGGGWSIRRGGSVSVPLVAVSGRQVLVLVARGQAIRETGLLHDLGCSGSGHRELCRDIGRGRGGEVGECVSHRPLVNNGRGESALNGVRLKSSGQHHLQVIIMMNSPCQSHPC